MTKLIILVLAYLAEPWETIINEGQKKTWAKDKIPDVETFFYYGNPDIKSPTLQGQDLSVPCSEGMMNIGLKTLLAFQYIIDNFKDTTHIYRINASSYLHIPGLLNFIQSHPKELLYSGIIGEHQGNKFVSGCGYLLSINAVKKALTLAHTWNHNLIDDIALGQILIHNCGITPVFCPRQDVYNQSMIDKINKTDSFLFRCKSDGNRYFDVKAMHHIHNLFKG